jgi:hypothetical protein
LPKRPKQEEKDKKKIGGFMGMKSELKRFLKRNKPKLKEVEKDLGATAQIIGGEVRDKARKVVKKVEKKIEKVKATGKKMVNKAKSEGKAMAKKITGKK